MELRIGSDPVPARRQSMEIGIGSDPVPILRRLRETGCQVIQVRQPRTELET